MPLDRSVSVAGAPAAAAAVDNTERQAGNGQHPIRPAPCFGELIRRPNHSFTMIGSPTKTKMMRATDAATARITVVFIQSGIRFLRCRRGG